MRIDTIDELAEVLQKSSLTVLDVQAANWSLTIEQAQVQRTAPVSERAPAQCAPTPAAREGVEAAHIAYIEAHVVGVFHECIPAVAVAQDVDAGTLLGTIDALTIRNDIRASERGEVAAVQVEDGQPVEYGQVLFALRLSGGSE